MRRLRFLFACLLLLAIPLQGFAATSMLLCGFQPPHRAEVAHGHPAHAAHGHAGHDHAGAAADHSAVSKISDGAGTCSVCAACCHTIAISDTPQLPALAPPAHAIAAEPFVAISSRPSPVPDKPPRA